MNPTSQQDPINQDPINQNHRAMAVALELHKQHDPLATILFGSRARGSHDEEKSDIDIMLIREETLHPTVEDEAAKQAQETARQHYGREVQAHLVWVTTQEFQNDEPFINSLCTRAALEGMMISQHPEQFRSRYDTPNPPAPLYLWEFYERQIQAAQESWKTARVIMLNARGDQDAAQEIRLKIPWKYLAAHEDLNCLDACNWLVRAMHSALAAAIHAIGEIPKEKDTAGQHMTRLQSLRPGEDLSTGIAMENYANGELPEGMSEEEFANLAFQDVEKIRKLAMKLRRRTGRKGTKTT